VAKFSARRREGRRRRRGGGRRTRSTRRATLALRQLLRLLKEYPREPLLAAVQEAARYGLYDLDRLERMILRRVVRDYFLLDDGKESDD
jgi:hypothetical protein